MQGVVFWGASHGGTEDTGVGARVQGGVRLGGLGWCGGCVSHGGTEGTEVGAQMHGGFRTGTWEGVERKGAIIIFLDRISACMRKYNQHEECH